MTITESLRAWLRRAPGRVLRRGLAGVAPVVLIARLTSDASDLGGWPDAALFVLIVSVGWLVTDLIAVRLWRALVPVANTGAIVVRVVVVLAGPVGAYLLARSLVPGAVPDAGWPLFVLPVVSAVVHIADLSRVQPPEVYEVRVVRDSDGEPWIAAAGRRLTLTDRTGRARSVAAPGTVFALESLAGFAGAPLLVAGGSRGVIGLLRVPTGEVVTAHDAGIGPIRHLRSASVNGRPAVAAAGEQGLVTIWTPAGPLHGEVSDDSDGGRVRCAGHAGGVSGLEWFGTSGGDDVLLSVGADHMLRAWDPATGDQVTAHTVPGVERGLPRTLCRLRHERRHLVAVGADDGAIRILDPADGELVQRLEPPIDLGWLPVVTTGGGAIHALHAIETPAGTYLAAGGNFPGVQLWHLGTSTLQWVGWEGALDTKPRCGMIRSLAVRDGENGPELITGGYDERVVVLPLALSPSGADR